MEPCEILRLQLPLVGACIWLVHSAFFHAVHPSVHGLAMETHAGRSNNRKFCHLSDIFLSHVLPQKLRLIVRIDEDVKALREKMQIEAAKLADTYA